MNIFDPEHSKYSRNIYCLPVSKALNKIVATYIYDISNKHRIIDLRL